MYYKDEKTTVYHGDCREVIPNLGLFDSVVTDPPYGLSFMGKGWDHGVPGKEFWEIIKDACKPGAILLAFGGTRTYHRLTCAIEDAGWEIRDCMMWLYGTGFPKSMNIGKAIDREAGVEREVTGLARGHTDSDGVHDDDNYIWKPIYERKDKPATEDAKLWNGYGTALKPAWEPIILAMKPLDGTFANNAKQHGVAGLNIDECKIGNEVIKSHHTAMLSHNGENSRPWHEDHVNSIHENTGRFPANLILDEGILDEAKSRFFYCPKASRKERGPTNKHPTVKPLSLMRYLCRLTKTPTGGRVLDPFCGSGSTLLAAKLEDRESVGIDLEELHCKWSVDRLKELE